MRKRSVGKMKRNSRKVWGTLLVCIMLFSTILLGGCYSKDEVSGKNPSVSEIGEKIKQSAITSDMVVLEDKKFQKLYDINPDMIQEYYVNISSSNIKADEFAIIKVKDSKDVQAVKDKISKRLDNQMESFKDYLPAEYSILQAHILKVKGNYILFAVSKDANKAEDIFDSYFK
jgi:hypothetical protein